jgi:glycosyltransferase involved in cell wall biosynthesis
MNKYKNLDDVHDRIESNYKFIESLEKYIDKCQNDDERLSYLTFIGYLYSEYVTGVYSSNRLENEIIKIGEKIQFSPTAKPQKGNVLHVMTAAGNGGGHTSIVNNWIQWDKDRQYSLVLTDMDYQEIPSYIIETISASHGKVICLEGSYIEKAKQLLKISQVYEQIILHTHMYDVIPLLAYSNCNWKIPVFFYNHADFRFSYGYSVADAVLNLNKFDWEKSRDYRGVANGRNLVFPSPNGGYIDSIVMDENVTQTILSKYRINKKAKLIVSMGDEFKYEDIIGYRFTDFVNRLIDESHDNIQFIIIGPNPKRKKWKELEERTNGHARAVGYIERRDVYGLIKMCDLFICSFPMRASGAGLAERWGVPYLSLFVIEREMEFFEENKAETIEELLDKSFDILNGNKTKYKGHCLERAFIQEEWQKKWDEIIEKYPVHSVTKFKENRYIRKQEYVNCQLMQDTASEHVAGYLHNLQINEPLREEIFYLDHKYGMNIFHKMEILEKDLEISKRYHDSNKHLKLYLMAMEWVQIKQKGKSIENYLSDKGCRSVAIYGMSYMGEAIYHELQGSEIAVLYGIDQKADQICTKLKVYHPCEAEEKVDLIINSTTLKNQIIRKNIEKLQNIPMLSIKEILDAAKVK